MTNFPTNLDTIKKDWNNTTPVKDTHPNEHNLVAESIEAIEAKVGVDGSAVTASHDFKLSSVPSGEKVVSSDSTDTLTNKTLTSPIINSGIISDSSITNPTITSLDISDEEITISDNADSTKKIGFKVSGNTTGVVTTINTNSTSNSSIELPDGNVTLVGRATNDTLTNKTINGDDNTITNLDTTTIKASTLVTSTDTIAINANDTTIPTSKAVKDYADSLSPGGSRIGFGSGSTTITHNLGVIPSIIEFTVNDRSPVGGNSTIVSSAGFANINISTGARISGGVNYNLVLDTGSSETLYGGSSTSSDFAYNNGSLSTPNFGTVSSVSTTTITLTTSFPINGIWKVIA